MPTAIRVIDRASDLADWNQASFLNGYVATWDAGTGKYVGQDLASIVSVGRILVSGVDTSGLPALGLCGYVSANGVLTPTDSTSLTSSRFFGISTDTVGTIVVAGVTPALFTTAGGSPSPGHPVWLAHATEESGAAGKLTSTPPSTGVCAEIGLCLDNSSYASDKTAVVLIQTKHPIIY